MGDELFPARPRSSLEVSVPEGVIEDLGLPSGQDAWAGVSR